MRHNNKKLSVSGAKANFSASMEEAHPLKSTLQTHPMLALGVMAAAGFLVGRAGTKVFKKTGSLALKTLSAPALPLVIIKKLFL